MKTFVFNTLLFCLLGAQTASAGYIYQIDDGSPENDLGVSGGGAMAWGNQYNAVSGAEWVTHLHIYFSASSFIGSAVTGSIYADPDQNAHPSDAVPLANALGVANEGWTIFAFESPVYVGPAGTSFFAVATTVHSGGQHPAAFDQSSDVLRSWASLSAAFSEAGNISLDYGYSGNFMIRAGSGEATGGEIPEPGTAALLAGALLVLGALARRR